MPLRRVGTPGAMPLRRVAIPGATGIARHPVRWGSPAITVQTPAVTAALLPVRSLICGSLSYAGLLMEAACLAVATTAARTVADLAARQATEEVRTVHRTMAVALGRLPAQGGEEARLPVEAGGAVARAEG